MSDNCKVVRCKKPYSKRKLCNHHYRILRESGSLQVSSSETMVVPTTPCSIEDCTKTTVGRGLCSRHYGRNYKFGDPLLSRDPSIPEKTDDERFWEKVDKSGDCWLWLGAVDEWGKGKFTYDGKLRMAHRYAYTRHHDVKLTKGELIRQLCKEPSCVRPEHLARAAETEYHYDSPVTTLRNEVN